MVKLLVNLIELILNIFASGRRLYQNYFTTLIETYSNLIKQSQLTIYFGVANVVS